MDDHLTRARPEGWRWPCDCLRWTGPTAELVAVRHRLWVEAGREVPPGTYVARASSGHHHACCVDPEHSQLRPLSRRSMQDRYRISAAAAPAVHLEVRRCRQVRRRR